MKYIIHVLLVLGFLSTAHSQVVSIPVGYLADKYFDGKCVLIKNPKNLFGTEVCMHDLDFNKVAIQSGLFEGEQGHWVLSGSGIPNHPMIEKYSASIFMYGVAICAIENNSGFHGAGGKCFHGISSIKNHSLTFRSKSVPMNAWSAEKLDMHKKLMRSFSKLNLKES